jgi:hypothetical protein
MTQGVLLSDEGRQRKSIGANERPSFEYSKTTEQEKDEANYF